MLSSQFKATPFHMLQESPHVCLVDPLPVAQVLLLQACHLHLPAPCMLSWFGAHFQTLFSPPVALPSSHVEWLMFCKLEHELDLPGLLAFQLILLG